MQLGTRWVLGRFGPEEERRLPEFLERAGLALQELVELGLGAAQNRFNRRLQEEGAGDE